MGRIQTVSNNMYRKIPTGIDYARSTGVLKDTFFIVTASQASSRYMSTGFIYALVTNELEVYVNGALKTANRYIDGVSQGDYSETSSSQVRFNTGIISTDDEVRFRVTSAYYRETYTLFGERAISATFTVKATIGPTGCTLDATGYYQSIDISDSIADEKCSVYCFDVNNNRMIRPLEIEHPDITQVKIYMPDDSFELKVIITG